MAAAASVLAGRGAKCPAMGRGARRRHRGWPGALPGLGSEPAVSSTNMSEQLKSLVKAGDRLLAPHRLTTGSGGSGLGPAVLVILAAAPLGAAAAAAIRPRAM